MARQYHHGDLRSAFLDTALGALQDTGVMPSWRALARACGVSQTAPYRHFPSREALEDALAAECFRRMSAAILAASTAARGPLEALAAGLAAYVAFGRSHPSWYELMFGRPAGRHPVAEVQEAGRAAYQNLIDAVAACGVAAPASASAAFRVWCAVHGLTDIAATGMRPPVSVERAEALGRGVIEMCVAEVRALAGAASR